MPNFAYLVQMDIADDWEDEFNRVYDTEHAKYICNAAGVVSCTRYRLESTDAKRVARYAALYEMDDPVSRSPMAGRPRRKRATGLPKSGRTPPTAPTPYCVASPRRWEGRQPPPTTSLWCRPTYRRRTRPSSTAFTTRCICPVCERCPASATPTGTAWKRPTPTGSRNTWRFTKLTARTLSTLNPGRRRCRMNGLKRSGPSAPV